MSQGRSNYIAVPRYIFIPNLFRFSDRAFLCVSIFTGGVSFLSNRMCDFVNECSLI